MQPQFGIPHSDVPFDDLAYMRDIARQLLGVSVQSLAHYRDYRIHSGRGSGGYYHILDEDRRTLSKEDKPRNLVGKYSKASTATVVHFLVTIGRWCEDDQVTDEQRERRQKQMAKRLMRGFVKDEEWTSAKLPPDNAFTVGFLLELAGDLSDMASLSVQQIEVIKKKLTRLRKLLIDGNGAIAVESGLKNAYTTQLAMRVLRSWDDRLERWFKTQIIQDQVEPYLDIDIQAKIRSWAMSSVDTEIARYTVSPSSLDVFELGYATMLVFNCTPTDLTPTQRLRLLKALELVFKSQLEDGSWPRSRRLFHYPLYGNAYCYDYEFLTQLLDNIEDPLLLRPYLSHLRKAIDRLVTDRVRLPERLGLDEGYGWLSGHHPQLDYPESWSTASCFHFVHLLDRFVANAIGDVILQYLGSRPLHPRTSPDLSKFCDLLDSRFKHGDQRYYLKRTLWDKLIHPVRSQLTVLNRGGSLSTTTPLSAILHGPPGTSKTTYVRAIASAIGWPLIVVDPSHFLRHGMSEIFSEMNTLFGMLSYADSVVIFFDEIDELVRTRGGEGGEAASRFLTTSMLPKIAALREERRLLFFVATNHLNAFDTAIARPDRFDMILPVMPPTAKEKIKYWDLADVISKLRIDRAEVDTELEKLTFSEFGAIAGRLQRSRDRHDFSRILDEAIAACTLNSPIDVSGTVISTDNETWGGQMAANRHKTRVP